MLRAAFTTDLLVPLWVTPANMDLDDLFGAFDGTEKINDVHEAKDELSDSAGKRKAPREEGHGIAPTNKRQALQPNEGTKSGAVVDISDSASAAMAGDDGKVLLKEGEESSTLREDGTFVKSVSTSTVAQHERHRLVPCISRQVAQVCRRLGLD